MKNQNYQTMLHNIERALISQAIPEDIRMTLMNKVLEGQLRPWIEKMEVELGITMLAIIVNKKPNIFLKKQFTYTIEINWALYSNHYMRTIEQLNIDFNQDGKLIVAADELAYYQTKSDELGMAFNLKYPYIKEI